MNDTFYLIILFIGKEQTNYHMCYDLLHLLHWQDVLLNLRLSNCISKKVVDKGLIPTNNIVTQLCSAQVAVERKVFQSWNDQSLHKLKRIVHEEFVFIFFSQNIFSNTEYSGQKNIRKLVRFFSWFVKAVAIKFSHYAPFLLSFLRLIVLRVILH